MKLLSPQNRPFSGDLNIRNHSLRRDDTVTWVSVLKPLCLISSYLGWNMCMHVSWRVLMTFYAASNEIMYRFHIIPFTHFLQSHIAFSFPPFAALPIITRKLIPHREIMFTQFFFFFFTGWEQTRHQGYTWYLSTLLTDSFSSWKISSMQSLILSLSLSPPALLFFWKEGVKRVTYNYRSFAGVYTLIILTIIKPIISQGYRI